MKADDLDKLFDGGSEDLLPHLDLAKAVRPGHGARRVNVDFPQWLLSRLDLEADRLGVPRQSLIKVWIAERLTQAKQIRSTKPSARPGRRTAARPRM